MERFWSKAVPHDSGCLLWQAAQNAKGYGRFMFNGRNRYAHNISWILNNGPIPSGLVVMHICDIRNCVNPAHLRLGTHADNVADMDAKGRGRRIPRCKLTASQVMYIRSSDERRSKLAAKYGISREYINQLQRGEYRV